MRGYPDAQHRGMETTSDEIAIISDNHSMNGSGSSPLVRILQAPFTKRTWTEVGYAFVSVPLVVAALAFIVPMLHNGGFWGLSTPGVRKLGGASRHLSRTMLGQEVAEPPPLRRIPCVRVRTPDAIRLGRLAEARGAKVSLDENKVKIIGLPLVQVAALATDEHITVQDWRPEGSRMAWWRGAVFDRPAWRTRGYFLLKLLITASQLVKVGVMAAGLFYLTYPIWWSLTKAGPWLLGGGHITTLAGSFVLVPFGAILLLAAPWLLHVSTRVDAALIRGLLGPGSPRAAGLARRVHDLERTRAHAVDDSAARLRDIERDLHDGAQAQLVAMAMKLGLAKEKLHAEAASPADLARITQLVEDAHRNAVEAIHELRTLARGIHPSVLDNGLADALATLAARSATPVELVADIPERPSAAIETIAYFCAAELLANVGKHSGARHATLEAVHVPGLVRIRVTDDGHGGAALVPDGGLSGLAARIRTVDGHLRIDSPPGGPTVITAELPSHA
jgi:signal transduction histidine kinase